MRFENVDDDPDEADLKVRWFAANEKALAVPFPGHPEVSACHDGRSGEVRLTLTNPGAATIRLTVADAYGKERATHVLRPGGRVVDTVNTCRANGWYDISVTSDRDARFLRRLAGHVETGRPSTSDPAIIAD